MQAPSAAELVDVWERALSSSLPRRILDLLGAACPELGETQLAAMPIGRRDALLLDLRTQLFGPELVAVASCPRCGQTVEAIVPANELRSDSDRAGAAIHRLEISGFHVAFRLPASEDLLAIEAARPAADLRSLLLARCIVEAQGPEGAHVGVEGFPAKVLDAVAADMAAADPQADLELAFACPACRHQWAAPFDIASFLWAEIHAWAQRLLRDIDHLARAYGWREPDVLALSPTRRNLYVELSRQ